jgi:hypothetical protein
MSADRATLKAPPPEAKRLDRCAGYPPGSEEVTTSAPHDRVEPEDGTSPSCNYDSLDTDKHTGCCKNLATKEESRSLHGQPRSYVIRPDIRCVTVPTSITVISTLMLDIASDAAVIILPAEPNAPTLAGALVRGSPHR